MSSTTTDWKVASSPEMYDRKAKECQNQATPLGRKIDEIRAGTPAPAQDAIDMMALTSRTAELFLIQPPHEKQAFLRLVLKSAAWRHGELQTQFEEPFENLKRSNQLSRRKDSAIGDGTTRNQIWLPRHGFEPRFTAPKAAVLPLDDRGLFDATPLFYHPALRSRVHLAFAHSPSLFGTVEVQVISITRKGHAIGWIAGLRHASKGVTICVDR